MRDIFAALSRSTCSKNISEEIVRTRGGVRKEAD